MTERIRKLADCHPVSGCEGAVRECISEEIRARGLTPVTDETGCVSAVRPAGGEAKHRILVSVPMDIPGYLALYAEKKLAVLFPTGGNALIKEHEKIDLIGEDGRLIRGSADEKDGGKLTVHSDRIRLGDAFHTVPDISADKDRIRGRFAARLSLILLLLDLAETRSENEVIIHFAAGGATRSQRAASAVRRTRPDAAILLGAVNDPGERPVLLIKDGKAFCDRALCEEIASSAKGMPWEPVEKVAESPVTKAEKVVASEAVPVLSVSLPFRGEKNGAESFSLAAWQNLFRLLNGWL